MDRRGGTSFIILFILNPIVILFYQNCSVLPTHATGDQSGQRTISSQTADGSHHKICRLVSVKEACAE